MCYFILFCFVIYFSGYLGSLFLNKWEYFKIILSVIFGGSDLNKNNLLYMDFNKMKMLIERIKLKEVDYLWKYFNFGILFIGYVLGIVIVLGKGYWDIMNDFFYNEFRLKDIYLGILNNNL